MSFMFLPVSFGMLFRDFVFCVSAQVTVNVSFMCVCMCVCVKHALCFGTSKEDRDAYWHHQGVHACCHSEMRWWLELEKGRVMKRDSSLLGLTLLSQHRFPILSLMHQLTAHFSVRANFHDVGNKEINKWKKAAIGSVTFPRYQFLHTNSFINMQTHCGGLKIRQISLQSYWHLADLVLGLLSAGMPPSVRKLLEMVDLDTLQPG